MKIIIGILVGTALGIVTNVVSGFIAPKTKRGKRIVWSAFAGLVVLSITMALTPDLGVPANNLIDPTSDMTELQAICGELKLTDMRPPALLEGYTRQYKFFGEGFCADTAIFLDSSAFVGSDTQIPPNSAPIEVASDGTWMSVYINVVSMPQQEGVNVIVKNPAGDLEKMFVSFQR